MRLCFFWWNLWVFSIDVNWLTYSSEILLTWTMSHLWKRFFLYFSSMFCKLLTSNLLFYIIVTFFVRNRSGKCCEFSNKSFFHWDSCEISWPYYNSSFLISITLFLVLWIGQVFIRSYIQFILDYFCRFEIHFMTSF